MNCRCFALVLFAVIVVLPCMLYGGDVDATAPKVSQLTPEQMMQRGGHSRTMDELAYLSSKPMKPDRGPAFKEFNQAFDKHEQYKADVIDWRIRGYELRQKYNDPNGFKYR